MHALCGRSSPMAQNIGPRAPRWSRPDVGRTPVTQGRNQGGTTRQDCQSVIVDGNRSRPAQKEPDSLNGGPDTVNLVRPLRANVISARVDGRNKGLSLIHISEPTRQAEISYAVF